MESFLPMYTDPLGVKSFTNVEISISVVYTEVASEWPWEGVRLWGTAMVLDDGQNYLSCS